MSDRLTPEREAMPAPAEPGEPVCASVHWDLPVECVLPRTHRENWHVGANPLTGSWFRYRYPIRSTHELVDGRWVDRTEPKPDRLTPEREAEIAAHLKSTTNWSLGNLAARDLLAELAAVRAERDLAQRKVASLKAEQDRDDAEYAAVIAERDSAREALREACDQIAALESDLGGATARIAELEAERLTTNEALDDAVQELRRRSCAACGQLPAALVNPAVPNSSGTCRNCGSAPDQWCPDCAACERGCFDAFDGNACTHAQAKWGNAPKPTYTQTAEEAS
jgi:hypothetical protein